MNSQDASQWHANFKRDGFLFVKGFFDTQTFAELSESLVAACSLKVEQSNLNSDGLTFYSNLFRLIEELPKLLAHDKLSSLMETLSGSANWVRWDQMITKSPNGVEFPWHRDNAYNKLKKEHFQLWIPTTEMNAQNGGLWVIPGSHQWAKVEHRKVGTHWLAEVDDNDAHCIEAQPRDILVFSSRLFHKTKVNTTPFDRTAYVVEFMKQSDFDPGIEAPFLFINNGVPVWKEKHPKDNWLSRRSASLRGKEIRAKRNI